MQVSWLPQADVSLHLSSSPNEFSCGWKFADGVSKMTHLSTMFLCYKLDDVIDAEPSSNLQHKLHHRMGYVLASAKMGCFENSSGELAKFLVKQTEDPLHKSWAGLSAARVWSCTVAVDKWIPILRYRDGFSINHNECIILSHSQTMVWKEKTPQNRSRGKHWHSWLCLTHWRLGDMAVISKV